MDLKEIEELMKLMSLHKVDKLVFNGLELCKSKHEGPKSDAKETPVLKDLFKDEDLLFYSTSAPSLSEDELMISTKPIRKK